MPVKGYIVSVEDQSVDFPYRPHLRSFVPKEWLWETGSTEHVLLTIQGYALKTFGCSVKDLSWHSEPYTL